MPQAQPSGFVAVATASLPPKPKRTYTRRAKPKPTLGTDFFGYLNTGPIRELPSVIAQFQAAAAACTEGSDLYQELSHQLTLAQGALLSRQAEAEDAALADRFERIRSGQEPLIRPGQTQELPADTLRRTLRQAALTTDWSEAQKQGDEPHPFLLALLQHDPTELVDVLREAAIAFWLAYLGRYWRNHRNTSRDCGDRLLFQPWRGPAQKVFATTTTAWLENHPDTLHPGWASRPDAVRRLLELNLTNPGYRLVVAEAMAKEHAVTLICSSRNTRETGTCLSDFTLAAHIAHQFDIALDPLSLPEWVVPAECGLWRSSAWRREGTFGVDFDQVSWGAHRRRRRLLPRLSKNELFGAHGGSVSLLELIAPERYSRKPSRGRPPGTKDKKPRRKRGPRGTSPEALARYQDRLKQAELRKTEAETKVQVLREAEEQGTDPRVAIHLAVLAGRLPRQAGGQRKYIEAPQPSTQGFKPITRLRLALGEAMAMAPNLSLGPQPTPWTPEELDGSVPHPLVRALLDPSIPEEDVTKVGQERDLAFRLGRKGQGFGGRWLRSPDYAPDWAAKCAERWWPAEDEIWFAAPGSPGALEEASRGRVALVGAGAGKGALQQQLEALEAQHKELMRELEDEDHYWDPGKESREELDERLDALEAQADRVWDEMEAIRGQAETEASLAIGGERERFERLLAPYAWLDPNYCRALRTALEEAQARKALKGDRRMAPESRLPMEGDGTASAPKRTRRSRKPA